MRILGAIVEPATDLLAIGVADLSHRRRVSAKPVGHELPRSAVFLHDALEKLHRRRVVSLRSDDRFQDLAFMSGPLSSPSKSMPSESPSSCSSPGAWRAQSDSRVRPPNCPNQRSELDARRRSRRLACAARTQVALRLTRPPWLAVRASRRRVWRDVGKAMSRSEDRTRRRTSAAPGSRSAPGRGPEAAMLLHL